MLATSSWRLTQRMRLVLHASLCRAALKLSYASYVDFVRLLVVQTISREDQSEWVTDMSGLPISKATKAVAGTKIRLAAGWLIAFPGLSVLLWAFFTLWFYYIYHNQYKTGLINDLSNLYLLIPLIGGLYGLYHLSEPRESQGWGRSVWRASMRFIGFFKLSNRIYRTYRLAPWLFCCGLLLWAVGCAIGIYYNVFHDEKNPYAFVGDIFFALCFICWCVGIVSFYERAGKNVINEANTTIAILVALWSALVTILYLIQGGDLRLYISRTGVLAFVLDMFFPLIDLLNLGLLVTLLPGPGNEQLHIKGKALRLIVLGYFFSLSR
jgi:hypothetical protein